MALECGAAMHEVYAAIRVWQLEHVQKLPRHAEHTAERIFGAGRWARILEGCDVAGRDAKVDEREHLQELAYQVLDTSGYTDDPKDETRTLHNMKLSALTYIDEQLPKLDLWPIYVEDKKNPKCRVGVEQVFDVVLEYSDGKFIRYVGTIDGLIWSEQYKRWTLDENKTSVRLSYAWKLSFEMRHQVTGYCASSTTVFGFPVMDCRVMGNKIKPSGKDEDVVPVLTSRNAMFILHWGRWVRRLVGDYEKYWKDWENAERFTHSCHRFFRPCSLLQFCADTPEGRKLSFDQEMVPASLSPSERAVMEGM
jgi:hypothetical protein